MTNTTKTTFGTPPAQGAANSATRSAARSAARFGAGLLLAGLCACGAQTSSPSAAGLPGAPQPTATAAAKPATEPAAEPAVDPAAGPSPSTLQRTQTVSFTESDFRQPGQAHRQLQLTLPVGARLVLNLGANPSTGHVWNEEADVGDSAVLRQTGHRFTAPDRLVPGAGGTAQWALRAVAPGATEARWAYAPAWAPAERVWSLTIRVQVR